jgi:hypothetical protein
VGHAELLRRVVAGLDELPVRGLVTTGLAEVAVGNTLEHDEFCRTADQRSIDLVFRSPDSVIRTNTDRRRSTSIPTTCGPSVDFRHRGLPRSFVASEGPQLTLGPLVS